MQIERISEDGRQGLAEGRRPDVATEVVAPDPGAEGGLASRTRASGPISDRWAVPYCVPTVKPHGEQEPQAPGSGMNEDGFYVFGTLADAWGERVYIRDDASGTVFGPFPKGTRIKWVEANGADPTISPMGSNNGNGQAAAQAVDYQIRAQGDAEAFFVDEKGVEVSVTCLVPPFPK